MDQLKLLKEHCKFNNEYEVYVLFGISRKKQNNITGSQEKVFREVLRVPSDIEKKYNRLKNHIKSYRDDENRERNFYMYVSVNPRDVRKAFFQMQDTMNNISQEQWFNNENSMRLKRLDKFWLSALMQFPSKSGRGLFQFDIDTKENIENIKTDIKMFTTIKLIQETKNGYHILTEPFNRSKFNELYKDNDKIEVKRDSLLFVEAI